MSSNNQIFNPTYQSRYEPENNRTPTRQQQLQQYQSELQDMKNQIIQSQRKQNDYDARLSQNQPLGNQQQYYQSQFDNNNNNARNQSMSYYGKNKNTQNPFNQVLEVFTNPGHHEQFNQQLQVNQNTYQDQDSYRGGQFTGFSMQEFDKEKQQNYHNSIMKVQERDWQRTQFGTHPEQLKTRDGDTMRDESLDKQGQYKSLNNHNKNINKDFLLKVVRNLHDQRLVSASGLTLQAILFFYMHTMTSNNVDEKKLAAKFEFVHIVITIFFLSQLIWNFIVSKQVKIDFNDVKESLITLFMLIFSIVSLGIYLVSCVFYAKEFYALRDSAHDDDNETKILNYFIIVISFINIQQLWHSVTSTWMLRNPPKTYMYNELQ